MQIRKIKDKDLLRSVEAGSGVGLYNSGDLVGFFLYTWEDRNLYIDGVSVKRDFRKYSRRLLRAAVEVVKLGKPRVVYVDTQSTAGERMVKLVQSATGVSVVDFGKLDRIINGEKVSETGAWEKYI